VGVLILRFGIDDDTIWSIIEDDIPDLLAALGDLKRTL